LSPLLLVLVVDVFKRMLHLGKESEFTGGLGLADFSFVNLQFADNLIIFCF